MKIKFKKYWRKTSLKNEQDAHTFLNHVNNIKPKNFLEIGVFHGVTARNVCDLLFKIHGRNFQSHDDFAQGQKVLPPMHLQRLQS